MQVISFPKTIASGNKFIAIVEGENVQGSLVEGRGTAWFITRWRRRRRSPSHKACTEGSTHCWGRIFIEENPGFPSQIRVNRDRIFKLLRSPGIDSKKPIPPDYVACAGILEQSLGTRNPVGRGLSYRPARARICKRLRFINTGPVWQPYLTYRPARLAESISWNRFLGSWNIYKFGR